MTKFEKIQDHKEQNTSEKNLIKQAEELAQKNPKELRHALKKSEKEVLWILETNFDKPKIKRENKAVNKNVETVIGYFDYENNSPTFNSFAEYKLEIPWATIEWNKTVVYKDWKKVIEFWMKWKYIYAKRYEDQNMDISITISWILNWKKENSAPYTLKLSNWNIWPEVQTDLEKFTNLVNEINSGLSNLESGAINNSNYQQKQNELNNLKTKITEAKTLWTKISKNTPNDRDARIQSIQTKIDQARWTIDPTKQKEQELNNLISEINAKLNSLNTSDINKTNYQQKQNELNNIKTEIAKAKTLAGEINKTTPNDRDSKIQSIQTKINQAKEEPTVSSKLEFSNSISEQTQKEFKEIFGNSQPERSLVEEISPGKYQRQLVRVSDKWAIKIIWPKFDCDRDWKLKPTTEQKDILTFKSKKIQIQIGSDWKISQILNTTEVQKQISEDKNKIKETFKHISNWPRNELLWNEWYKLLKQYEADWIEYTKIIWPDMYENYFVQFGNIKIKFKVNNNKVSIVSLDEYKESTQLTETKKSTSKIEFEDIRWSGNTQIKDWIFLLHNWNRWLIQIKNNADQNHDEIYLVKCDASYTLDQKSITDNGVSDWELYNNESFNNTSVSIWKHFKCEFAWHNFTKTKWAIDSYTVELFEKDKQQTGQKIIKEDLKFKNTNWTIDLTETNKAQNNIPVPFDRNFARQELSDKDLAEITNWKLEQFFELSKHTVNFTGTKVRDHDEDPRFTSRRSATIWVNWPETSNDKSNRNLDYDTENDANTKIENMNNDMSEVIKQLQFIKNLKLWDNDENKLSFWDKQKNDRYWDWNWPLWWFSIKDDTLNNYLSKVDSKEIFNTDWSINFENINIDRKIKTKDNIEYTIRFKIKKVWDNVIINQIYSVASDKKEAINTVWGTNISYVIFDNNSSNWSNWNIQRYNSSVDYATWTISFQLIERVKSNITDNFENNKINAIAEDFKWLTWNNKLKRKENLITSWHQTLTKFLKSPMSNSLKADEMLILEDYLTFMSKESSKNWTKIVNLMNVYLDPDSTKNQKDTRKELKKLFEPEFQNRKLQIQEGTDGTITLENIYSASK